MPHSFTRPIAILCTVCFLALSIGYQPEAAAWGKKLRPTVGKKLPRRTLLRTTIAMSSLALALLVGCAGNQPKQRDPLQSPGHESVTTRRHHVHPRGQVRPNWSYAQKLLGLHAAQRIKNATSAKDVEQALIDAGQAYDHEIDGMYAQVAKLLWENKKPELKNVRIIQLRHLCAAASAEAQGGADRLELPGSNSP